MADDSKVSNVGARYAQALFDLASDEGQVAAVETDLKSLKAALEGGIEGRPDNVIFYATSNRRHLMPREMMENERSTAIAPRATAVGSTCCGSSGSPRRSARWSS